MIINPYVFAAAGGGGGGAIPSLRAVATINSPTISTLTLPTGWQAGDLHLMVLETANETVATPSGWNIVTNSPQGTGTAAGASSSMLSVFYRWAQSGDAGVTIANVYNHVIGFIAGFYNVNATTPFNATAGDVEATSTTSVTYPSITTTVGNCLVLYLATSMVDTTTPQITSSTFAGLTNIGGPYGGSLTYANGGGAYMFKGDKVSAGSTGTGSSTAAGNTVQGRMTIALCPL